METDKSIAGSYFAEAKSSLRQYAHLKCQKKNIELVWFRIFYAYGPSQRAKSLIPSLISSFKHKKTIEINNLLNANDFIYAGDVVEAFYRAVIMQIQPSIYNLGTGNSTSVYEVCRLAEEILFNATKISGNLLTKNSSTKSVDFWADMTKTKKALNWEAKVNLRSGIIETLQSLGKV